MADRSLTWMSSDKHWILDSVMLGRWVIHNLAPAFRKKLADSTFKQNVWPCSLNGLCLIYYGYASSLSELEGLDADSFLDSKIGSKASVVFERIVKKVFNENALLCSFSDAEKSAINKAADRLKQKWPDFDEPYRQVTLFVRTRNAVVLGASFPHTFGAVYYGDNLPKVDGDTLSVSLAHEVAHHELFLINLYDRLIVTEADRFLKYAPLQKKERPPIGRLHAFYALFRMIQAKRHLELRFQYDLKLLDSAMRSLRDEELTQYAKVLVKNVMDYTHSQ